MNLVIDCGNTRIKTGLFEESKLVQQESFSSLEELKIYIIHAQAQHLLVSSVNYDPEKILGWSDSKGKKVILKSTISLPIQLAYQTPDTLGVDRIAAACGAQELFPGKTCLVVDAGTCINYELLDRDGIYHGGIISPGISMRFEAMHKFTARLPLVKPNEAIGLIGNSTETCMQSGVMNGVLEEVNGIITQLTALYPDLVTIICGGDYPFFENRVKQAIFVAPEIVLIGLNRILRHHAEL